jgi:hypothetical protein
VTATGTAEFYDSAGILKWTEPVIISPRSAWTVNMYNGTDVASGSGLWAALPKNYQGSIKFSLNQDVVGVGFIQQPLPAQNYAGSFGLVSTSDATNIVYVPQYDRVCTGTAPCDSTTQRQLWNSYSNFSVINVGGSNATLSSIEFYNANGTLNLSYNRLDGTLGSGNIVLNPGASYSYSTFNGGALGPPYATAQALGVNFRGMVKIVAPAGAKLKAVSTLVQGKISSDSYNAFNK